MAKKKSKRVNFSKYKPIHDRRFNPAYMEEIQDSLINRGYGEAQRLAVLSSLLHESGGDPKAVDATGKFSGIAQWEKSRHPGSIKLSKQITKFLNDMESTEDSSNWTHGGSGVPFIKNAEMGFNSFWNSTDPYEAALYLNKGNIRPAEEQSRINRAQEAANMSKHMFNIGGPIVAPAGLSTPREVALDAVLLNGKQNAAKSAGNSISSSQVLGAASGALQGTLGMASAIKDISTVKDTSGYENQLTDVSNTTFTANNSSDLLNQINSQNTINEISYEDIAGTKQENLKSAGKAVGSGASAGAAIGSLFGPVGTAIGAGAGALVGGLSSWLGNSAKKREAERIQEELNQERLEAINNRQANLNVAASNLQQDNAANALINYAAEGGPLFNEFSNGITIINEGGSHSENPHEGVQVGVDTEGIPNLVEEGEVIFNDYVFSNRLKVDKNVRNKYKLRDTKELTFADAAKDIQKMSEEMPNDPVVRRTTELRLNQLMQEQEMVRQKRNRNEENNQFSFGGYKRYLERNGITLGNNVTKDNYKNQDNFIDYKNYVKNRNSDKASLSMQTAPIFGSLVAVGKDIFGGNKLDYTNVDKYETAINEAYNPIEARTLSDYIEYNPYDISFGLNKLSASQAASRRALANTTNNPAALRSAILASDYNYGNQIGEELRRAQEYNDANRRMVADFNRGTNQFNAQAINDANQFNALQAANKATALGQVAQWRDQIYNTNRAEKSGNLTGLYEGIAGLGETFMNLKDRRWLMDNGIIVGSDGKIIQLPNNEKTNSALKSYSPYKLRELQFPNAPTLSFDMDNFESKYGKYKKPAIKSKGGKIKRTKNKRRLS